MNEFILFYRKEKPECVWVNNSPLMLKEILAWEIMLLAVGNRREEYKKQEINKFAVCIINAKRNGLSELFVTHSHAVTN